MPDLDDLEARLGRRALRPGLAYHPFTVAGHDRLSSVEGGKAMQLAYVNIFVSDLTEAVAFYQGKLGLRLQFSSSEHRYASFSAGGVRLGIAVPGPTGARLIGRHTGVGLEVADLEAEHARLEALGVRFTMPPTPQPWGGLLALVTDPDGNILYLDQAAAGSGK